MLLKARNMASREVDRLHGSLGRVSGAAGKLGGVLTTLGKVGILGLVTAIGAAVGFLGLATKAAAEEQKGIDRLNGALKANVKGFRGNTDAIEAVIKKREDLAFSDDALRDSLTLLVVKYKDQDKALALQATAMDLARLKGISLQDATAMLSKGLDGNAKILKTLGINLPKTASEQERLTAIQKAAAGQAELYGKSAAGAQEAFGIATADVVEDIGAGLLPIMTQAFTWLRTNAIPAVRGIVGRISAWMDANRPLINQIRDVLVKVIGMAIEKIAGVVKWIGSVVAAIASNRDAMNVLRTIFAGIAEAVGLVWKAIAIVVTWIGNVVATITSNKAVMKGLATTFDIIAGAVKGIVDVLRQLVDWAGRAIGALSNIKLPDVTGITDLIPHLATGAIVNPTPGGTLAVLGEANEREFVIPESKLGAGRGTGVSIVGVTQREILDMVDRGLYFRLQRAAATAGKV